MSDEVMDNVVEESPLNAEDSIVDEVEEGIDEGVEELEELEGEEKTTTETSEVNGKTIRDTVRKLSEEHPEQAKLLKQLADEHFKTESTYKKLFATPEEATTAKELIDAVGGVDGVKSLQERIEAYDNNDSLLSAGDPKILDEIFTQFPEGAVALAPTYLEKLASANPQAFTEAVAPYVMNLLHTNGVFNHVSQMLQEKDPERLTQLTTQLATWLDNQIKGVNNLRSVSPQKGNGKPDALQAERAAIQEERNQIFTGKVETAAMSKMAPVVNSIISQQTKNFKLNDTQVDHYRKTLDKIVWDNLNANPNYNKQLAIRLNNKNRSPESVADYMSSEYNRVIKEVSFDTAKRIFGTPKGQAKETTVKKVEAPAVGLGKPILLSRPPQDSHLDWSKPNADIEFINNRGWLKSSGKFVTWK